MIKYFNQKKVLFLVFNSILVNSCLLVGSDEASITKRYYEVYNALVCAVLQDNVCEAAYLLKHAGFNPHKKIAYGYTLRHLAHSLAMDRLLLSHGIASDKETRRLSISVEVYNYCDGDEEVKSYIDFYNFNRRKFTSFCNDKVIQNETSAAKEGQRATRFETLATESIARADHFKRLSSFLPSEEKRKVYKELFAKELLKIFFFSLLAKKKADIARDKNISVLKFQALSTGFSYENNFDSRSLDARGFTPGKYSFAQRAEIARQIRNGRFVVPVKPVEPVKPLEPLAGE